MKPPNSEIKTKLDSVNPLFILNKWLREARLCPHYQEPWAMVLSTCVKGRVNSRVLLLKQIQGSKLFFYTNYLSPKGKEMTANPWAALNFYWPHLDRQIRIQGKAVKTSRRKSILYWQTRSRESQISQWISLQSQTLQSKKELEISRKKAEKQFHGKKIPCPKHWGGYAVQIQKIEFWINRKHRLHDRFLFEKSGKNWKKNRLFP